MNKSYRIQKREYSSNIIEKGVEEDNKIKWYPYIAPLCNKKEGDVVCEQIMKFYEKDVGI